ncbi:MULTISPECIES: S-adenosylmethionine decarboxylase [Paenibacillus]|uniref:S-adenosylmethionine decarboxylase n=1 Tax=Paenibacillus violae TaxID=3077234 RepID=A0ABU3RGY8_9BACL|nr:MULTISPECIES: S-adenosylmethionine decarboxylase [Paenibacillus]MDU0203528.1 S-adenosylmethionine decarboxylase [Paenibacillus sp. PFR10]MEC0270049.1 S-adenosylmethionine decarboxylase [Paenibacillus anseongense]
MRRKLTRKAILYSIVLFLIIWPIYQLSQMLGHHKEEHDASHLLYQVSLFQMELLMSYLEEAAQSKTTDELAASQQALYSAGYTHERLVLAAGGSDYLTPMSSMMQLSQYLQRLQIGGERALKPDELQTLKEAGLQYKSMYEVYEKIMASNGDIVSSQNTKLAELDSNLTAFLRKKLLQ